MDVASRDWVFYVLGMVLSGVDRYQVVWLRISGNGV